MLAYSVPRFRGGPRYVVLLWGLKSAGSVQRYFMQGESLKPVVLPPQSDPYAPAGGKRFSIKDYRGLLGICLPWKLWGYVRGLYGNARSFGVGAALCDLGYRGIRRVLPVRILKGMTAVMDDVDHKLFDTGGFGVRFSSPAELRAAAATPAWGAEMPPAFVERALARGDECVGIFDGATMVSSGWYARGTTPISDSFALAFAPVWRYMYKGFTLKSHRGKRLHGIGMTYALRHYTDAGARGLISYVEFNNLRSLRSVEKMGYRVFGDIYIATIGGRKRFCSTPGCRPYEFHLVPTAA
jgi:hypothetical protein